MFDKLEFRATLVRNGKTFADVAKWLGINESTLSRKVNGQTEFTRKEIQSICEFLGEENPMKIFFANDIA